MNGIYDSKMGNRRSANIRSKGYSDLFSLSKVSFFYKDIIMKYSQPHLEFMITQTSIRTTLRIVMIMLAQKKTSYYPLSQLVG